MNSGGLGYRMRLYRICLDIAPDVLNPMVDMRLFNLSNYTIDKNAQGAFE